MANIPGIPGGQVSNEGDLGRILTDMQRQIRELAAQDLLTPVGITAQPNGITVTGTETVNGPLNVNGTATIAGPMNVSGDTQFTGNTTISGNASVTGNITKSNSWGASSLGPVTFGTGAPGLTFTKSGTTYGQSVGIGLSRNTGNTLDQLIAVGPGSTDGAYLMLQSDMSFTLGSDRAAVGPQVNSTAGANGAVVLAAGNSNGAVTIYPYGTGKCQVYGNFAVTGTKAFLMDHPVYPDTMELMHAATESPVNGVEYWGTVTLDVTGQATATLPGYFEALTSATGRNIQLTPIGRATVQVSADRIVDGAFVVYGAPGQEVDWLVKAARQRIVDGYDELSFPVEIDKVLIGPQLP